MKKIKSIIIIATIHSGRNHNFNSTRCFINGISVGGSNIEYGCGDQYIYNAFIWMEKQKLIPKLKRFSNGAIEPPFRYCDDRGIELYRIPINVSSQKELFKNETQ